MESGEWTGSVGSWEDKLEPTGMGRNSTWCLTAYFDGLAEEARVFQNGDKSVSGGGIWETEETYPMESGSAEAMAVVFFYKVSQG